MPVSAAGPFLVSLDGKLIVTPPASLLTSASCAEDKRTSNLTGPVGSYEYDLRKSHLHLFHRHHTSIDYVWTADDIDAAAHLAVDHHGVAAHSFAHARTRMFESLNEPEDAERWQRITERIAHLLGGCR